MTSKLGEEEAFGVHEVDIDEIGASNTTSVGSEQLNDLAPVGERLLVQLEATIGTSNSGLDLMTAGSASDVEIVYT